MPRKKNNANANGAAPVATAPAAPAAPAPANAPAAAQRNTDPQWKQLERQAQIETNHVLSYLKTQRGTYLHDEDGGHHILVGGKRIPLNYDQDNADLDELLQESVQFTLHARPARPVISRLIRHARHHAGKFLFWRFSAMPESYLLLIPIAGAKPEDNTRNLLEVAPDTIQLVPNGNNKFGIWLEHPSNSPIVWSDSVDVRAGLAQFEELIVNGQATCVPEMSWFVALQEGLFVFLRDKVQNRLTTEHAGGPGEGKSSGPRWLVVLFSIGDDVIGKASGATLINIGDIGLLAVDNKELDSFDVPTRDFWLHLATGAEHYASRPDGTLRQRKHGRPVGAFTSIEGGPDKTEFGERRVRAEYCAKSLPPEKREQFDEDEHKERIKAARDLILPALVKVLQRAMQLHKDKARPITIPTGYDRFKGNYVWLVFLLRAFAELSGKTEAWADQIEKVWREEISKISTESSDPLEYPLLQFFAQMATEPSTSSQVEHFPLKHQGKSGTLYLVQMEQLFFWFAAHPEYRTVVPTAAPALGKRINNAKFRRITVLKEDEHAGKIPQWRNLKNRRRTGFFVVNE
jgi:hypothetical protein